MCHVLFIGAICVAVVGMELFMYTVELKFEWLLCINPDESPVVSVIFTSQMILSPAEPFTDKSK